MSKLLAARQGEKGRCHNRTVLIVAAQVMTESLPQRVPPSHRHPVDRLSFMAAKLTSRQREDRAY